MTNNTITTLLIPTLNEIDGLKEIMPRIKRGWVDQILFVDGGSTDGTQQYLSFEGYNFIVQEKKGMRNAYKEVFPHILGDIVITFSPDGNSVPEIIPDLVREIKDFDADMVIVSRYLNGAHSEDDDWITAFGNWMFTKLINIIYKGQYTDAMVIFRAYKRNLLSQIDLFDDSSYSFPEKILRTNISWEPLMSMRAARYGMNVMEIPGNEPPRIGGERKLRVFKWGAAYLWQILTDWRRYG